jgi:hypothetical protein
MPQLHIAAETELFPQDQQPLPASAVDKYKPSGRNFNPFVKDAQTPVVLVQPAPGPGSRATATQICSSSTSVWIDLVMHNPPLFTNTFQPQPTHYNPGFLRTRPHVPPTTCMTHNPSSTFMLAPSIELDVK